MIAELTVYKLLLIVKLFILMGICNKDLVARDADVIIVIRKK